MRRQLLALLTSSYPVDCHFRSFPVLTETSVKELHCSAGTVVQLWCCTQKAKVRSFACLWRTTQKHCSQLNNTGSPFTV